MNTSCGQNKRIYERRSAVARLQSIRHYASTSALYVAINATSRGRRETEAEPEVVTRAVTTFRPFCRTQGFRNFARSQSVSLPRCNKFDSFLKAAVRPSLDICLEISLLPSIMRLVSFHALSQTVRLAPREPRTHPFPPSPTSPPPEQMAYNEDDVRGEMLLALDCFRGLLPFD